MENKRIRIADMAGKLGVSTATVSNVIHGKTNKMSDGTTLTPYSIRNTGFVYRMKP